MAARLGLNRAAWNLRSDAGRQLPRDPNEPTPDADADPTGPELPPGTYKLKLSYAGHEVTREVQVLADPRSHNTPADWERRQAALRQAEQLRDELVGAIWKLRRTRDDVALVKQKARQAAEDQGEKEREKLDALPLVKAGAELEKKLTETEKRLWVSPETPGIRPDTDAYAAVSIARSFLLSSPEPPSPTQLEHLRRAEREVRRALAELDRVFASEVAAFRQQAAEARLGLLAQQ